jgi:hypothetical protein
MKNEAQREQRWSVYSFFWLQSVLSLHLSFVAIGTFCALHLLDVLGVY